MKLYLMFGLVALFAAASLYVSWCLYKTLEGLRKRLRKLEAPCEKREGVSVGEVVRRNDLKSIEGTVKALEKKVKDLNKRIHYLEQRGHVEQTAPPHAPSPTPLPPSVPRPQPLVCFYIQGLPPQSEGDLVKERPTKCYFSVRQDGSLDLLEDLSKEHKRSLLSSWSHTNIVKKEGLGGQIVRSIPGRVSISGTTWKLETPVTLVCEE